MERVVARWRTGAARDVAWVREGMSRMSEDGVVVSHVLYTHQVAGSNPASRITFCALFATEMGIKTNCIASFSIECLVNSVGRVTAS